MLNGLVDMQIRKNILLHWKDLGNKTRTYEVHLCLPCTSATASISLTLDLTAIQLKVRCNADDGQC